MNVYDKCHELARAISESREFKEYKELKEKIAKNASLKSQVDEFETIRYEEQRLALQGEKNSNEKMEKLQELYKILIENPEVKEYFDSEV